VAGRTAALRVSSPMGAFYQRDVLLRFELDGAGLGGPGGRGCPMSSSPR
jgi:hypothetical protein